MTHLAIEHALLAVMAADAGTTPPPPATSPSANQQTRATARRERQVVEIAALVVAGERDRAARAGARARRGVPGRRRASCASWRVGAGRTGVSVAGVVPSFRKGPPRTGAGRGGRLEHVETFRGSATEAADGIVEPVLDAGRL